MTLETDTLNPYPICIQTIRIPIPNPYVSYKRLFGVRSSSQNWSIYWLPYLSAIL